MRGQLDERPMGEVAGRRLLTALAQVEELSVRARAVQVAARDGSRWQADLQRSESHGRLVGMYAHQGVASALDHLHAWHLLAVKAAMGPSSPWTLARGAIEGGIRARWHLEPPTASGRVARAYAARRHDQQERTGFDAAPGPGPRNQLSATGKTAAQRLTTLSAQQSADKIPRQLAKFPGETELSRRYNLERFYRLASGHAHGLEYVVGMSELEFLPEESSNPGTRNVLTRANDEHLADAAEAVVALLTEAVADLEAYLSASPSGPTGKT